MTNYLGPKADADDLLTQGELVDPWHQIGGSGEPAFSNSWVNYDTTNWGYAAFMKDSLGIVHLRGLIKNGTVSTVAFTLPAGYRPSGAKYIFLTSTNTTVFGRTDVLTDGGVQVAAWGQGGNGWLSLANVKFRAAA